MRLNALTHVCPLLAENIPFDGSYFSNESLYDTIQDISLQKESSIVYCGWFKQDDMCLKNIVPVLTEDGLCFTLNALNSHEIYTTE